MRKFIAYVSSVTSEVRLSSWPTRRKILTWTIATVAFTSIVTATLLTLDTFITSGFTKAIELAGGGDNHAAYVATLSLIVLLSGAAAVLVLIQRAQGSGLSTVMGGNSASREGGGEVFGGTVARREMVRRLFTAVGALWIMAVIAAGFLQPSGSAAPAPVVAPVASPSSALSPETKLNSNDSTKATTVDTKRVGR